MFQNVSNVFEPKLYLAGNFIFNSSNFIRDFDENSYLTYRKFLTNGEYIFSEDLKKMGPSLRADLDFSNGQIPNIIQKLMSNEVSLFTACALEAMLGWTHFGGDDSNILFDDIIKRVRKSHKFFKININTYKGIVVSHYKTPSTK